MTSPPDSDHQRGVALHDAGDFAGALAAYDRALARTPGDAKLHYSRANALAMLGRFDQAIKAFERCVALDPAHGSAQYNRATVLVQLQRWPEALAGLDKTLSISPAMADAWNNRAGVLQMMGRYDEALVSIRQVLRLRPRDAQAFYNAGTMLLVLNRFEEAVQAFERTLQLDPSHADAFGCLGTATLRACDWPKLEKLLPALLDAVRAGRAVVPPLTLLALSDDPLLQKRCAEINTRRSLAGTALENADPAPLWDGIPYRHDRLRIGYVSSDFRDHPVANQVVGLLERHDRTRFEIIGLAIGGPDNGALRQRIMKACDRFHDLGGLGAFEAASLIRRLEIDILVDLNGHHTGLAAGNFQIPSRAGKRGLSGVCGHHGQRFHRLYHRRCAGHAFRSGAGHEREDRAIAPFLLAHGPPPAGAGFLSAAPKRGCRKMHLSFAASTPITKSGPGYSTSGCGCSTRWPGSVLWIREGAPAMNTRFRKEAEIRGVDASRVIFAPRMASFARHLGRMRQADLFLDTFPYNAHVTASDALWAGLPVVTLRGQSFASRVAAGFLAALGLEELVASTPQDYESLALELAGNSSLRQQIRENLWQARGRLFDIDRLVRDLESAYLEMMNRLESGPRAFAVTSVPA